MFRSYPKQASTAGYRHKLDTRKTLAFWGADESLLWMARPYLTVVQNGDRRKEQDHDHFRAWDRHWENSYSVVGLNEAGAVVARRYMRREGVIAFAAKQPACVVAMEACFAALHIGRILAEQRHILRLMSPEYVRP
mgnify:CR=1 FL=1